MYLRDHHKADQATRCCLLPSAPCGPLPAALADRVAFPSLPPPSSRAPHPQAAPCLAPAVVHMAPRR